jgi:hypothetical protein
MPSKFLTFSLLSELGHQAESTQAQALHDSYTRRIGPLVELAYQDYNNVSNKLAVLYQSQPLGLMLEALSKESIHDFPLRTSFKPKNVEFIRGFQTNAEGEDPRWIAFCKRLQGAVRSAGFEQSFSKVIAATVDEMGFNVVDHSGREDSSIVGYRSSPSEFEYVVCDAGIGVLESLRKNPVFSFLTTSDEALGKAVQEGNSRYGHLTDRGMGFRELFNNVANRGAYLRFRSGDYALVVDGTIGAPNLVIQPCRYASGFLISITVKTHL